MKKLIYIKTIFILLSGILFVGCFKDLDTVPIDEDVLTAEAAFDDPNSYKALLAKLYAGLAVTGQEGPAGQADIEGIDEGFGQYLRMYFYHQELTTEEAIIGWNDQTIMDFHDQDWGPDDSFIFALYSRLYYQVSICNEFLRETSDEKLNERGVEAALKSEIATFRAEARFLRALSYWHCLDLFRNVPFVTEADPVGSFFPEQIDAQGLFNFIESELLAIDSELAAPRANEYGRADQAAAWTLLAKLYINAEIYLGTPRYNDCIVACEKVIDAGFILDEEYATLFLADNHRSDEIIFPVTYDGIHTRTWGGMTFIIRSAIGGNMDPTESGVVSGWGGMRTTRQLVEQFPEGNGGGIAIAANPGTSHPKIYVIGEFQDWNPVDIGTNLSDDNGDLIFEGYKYFPSDNTLFGIILNPGNVGSFLGDNGNDGTLEMGGDSILVSQAGLYRLVVNRNDNTYTLDRTEWGVIGDATENGWDADTDMTWNADEQAMEVYLDLVPGEFKFRANDDWAINLGDNNGDAILTPEGANVVIDAGGAYQLLLYLNNPDYTFELRQLSFDDRGIFFSDGQSLDIADVSLFTDGYAITKFKNITSEGVGGSDTDFPDTDFPMFRLGDVLLMASEALLRDNGDRNKALDYFNQVRFRAYGSSAGHISDAELNLDMILDERARELYWECHRRTDLIRHGKFTESNYLWAWKGGVMEGAGTSDFRKVFPLPSADLGANPNLKQNDGY